MTTQNFAFCCYSMDQILSNGKNLPRASGRCVAVADKDQEWGTSGVSGQATSILVVY